MHADLDDDDLEDEDVNDESNDFMTISCSEEYFIAQVMAIRDAENSMDFYTLEVIDACYDHGYFKETPSDSSDDSTSPQYLCMHSKLVKRYLQQFNNTSSSFNSINPNIPSIYPIMEPTVTIVHDSSYSYTDAIIHQFSLNTEQILALRIVAEHVSAQHIDSFNQLLMGIFGEGGTGKSTLIEAIRIWFVVQG